MVEVDFLLLDQNLDFCLGFRSEMAEPYRQGGDLARCLRRRYMEGSFPLTLRLVRLALTEGGCDLAHALRLGRGGHWLVPELLLTDVGGGDDW